MTVVIIRPLQVLTPIAIRIKAPYKLVREVLRLKINNPEPVIVAPVKITLLGPKRSMSSPTSGARKLVPIPCIEAATEILA
jgi:hypothetical protein